MSFHDHVDMCRRCVDHISGRFVPADTAKKVHPLRSTKHRGYVSLFSTQGLHAPVHYVHLSASTPQTLMVGVTVLAMNFDWRTWSALQYQLGFRL